MVSASAACRASDPGPTRMSCRFWKNACCALLTEGVLTARSRQVAPTENEAFSARHSIASGSSLLILTYKIKQVHRNETLTSISFVSQPPRVCPNNEDQCWQHSKYPTHPIFRVHAADAYKSFDAAGLDGCLHLRCTSVDVGKGDHGKTLHGACLRRKAWVG